MTGFGLGGIASRPSGPSARMRVRALILGPVNERQLGPICVSEETFRIVRRPGHRKEGLRGSEDDRFRPTLTFPGAAAPGRFVPIPGYLRHVGPSLQATTFRSVDIWNFDNNRAYCSPRNTRRTARFGNPSIFAVTLELPGLEGRSDGAVYCGISRFVDRSHPNGR